MGWTLQPLAPAFFSVLRRIFIHNYSRMRHLLAIMLAVLSGCSLIPEVAHQPVVHNPFPQLTKVAVAPFFNLSTEPTVDGRQFALAYFNELQSVPGFEVIPVGTVELAARQYRLNLSNPEEARKLAQILEVDALVIGVVTDFSPYYPPRCAMTVEWYAANPCFHAIPPGYGLPWGTPQEEFIPAPLVLQSEMALARAQLTTQTPDFQKAAVPPPVNMPPKLLPQSDPQMQPLGELTSHKQPVPPAGPTLAPPDGAIVTAAPNGPGLPGNWPDGRAFVPQPPCAGTPDCQPTKEPVLRHTKTYNGNDPEFTEALASYVFFRDEARFGGWQSYLQRSDDFIRFCCHLHIFEMLSARGGAGESRVVWKWSSNR